MYYGMSDRSQQAKRLTHVRVHGLDLVPRGRSEDLDDLDELVDAWFSREKGLAQHQLSHDTSRRPDIWKSEINLIIRGIPLTNIGGVVGGTKDQLWSSVVSRADVADIWLASNENLGGSEITQHEDTGGGIEEEVLGFNVSVADSDRMDVGQRSEKLDISSSYKSKGDDWPGTYTVWPEAWAWPASASNSASMLGRQSLGRIRGPDWGRVHLSAHVSMARDSLNAGPYLFAVRVEERFEVDDVGVRYQPHDLQFSVLSVSPAILVILGDWTHLEPLVLQDLLDGNVLLWLFGSIFLAGCWMSDGSLSSSSWLTEHLCGKDDTETSISNNFAVGVADGSFSSSLAIRRRDGHDLVWVIR
jgi:hypothetical protein